MKYRSNSLLAFTPQNSIGEQVLLQAMYFSEALKMRIFALEIIQNSSIISKRFQTKKVETIQNQAIEKLTVFLEEILQKKLPKDIIPRIKFGNFLSTLIRESKKGGYDFVVIDKNENILKKTKLSKLICQSHCPILVTNSDFSFKKINKIVIPIDIAQTTKKRLLWATFFAQELGAKIQIVSALNINIDETKSLAFKNADNIKTMLLNRGVECDIKILKVNNQPKHKVILEYIKEESPEMVIIRTHQESIFSDTRIGQFVSEIVQNCKMPVFTVGHSTKLTRQNVNV